MPSTCAVLTRVLIMGEPSSETMERGSRSLQQSGRLSPECRHSAVSQCCQARAKMRQSWEPRSDLVEKVRITVESQFNLGSSHAVSRVAPHP